ncbi:putative aminopeptidase [Nostocoides japonicum T1-X7]|uniref:Aminopeptidase N n=1 Tax=Nostocoides japonicum T1-X7 TaxID=1194083 RepID=A0A077M3S0_9MICO|nr:aminopeptidase N [Tetrasphaera japonica]CCH78785.1 putative aminopeptidase [Tetrasphaera japonica T1-X7]CCH79398.1 putative aminopeptidase [Tetrasphaera japonica T1-X7]
MPSLTRDEAARRARSLTVTAMTVDLDLDQGARTFGSTTTIAFSVAPTASTAADPNGATTFVDVRPRALHRARLNGRDLDVGLLDDGRLPLTDLEEDNVLVVEATMGYSHDGQGLHRATDPADGEDYVYGHLFLDAAPTVFACFDQPDLKAPYTVTVTAPHDWTVLGNGAATQDVPGRWSLATTRPLATYFVTVCAGPWASVRTEHDGIPLGLHARRSLRGPLEAQAEQIFEITRQSFDYYHGLFGIRYPFGEYHQVWAPEFNAGAMENPGCVVFRDQYVYRGAVSRDQILLRSNTIAHEMAHMWFGDLVTMRWWDDLWLNESFAEYMSHRTLHAATEFTEAWVDATVTRKAWGYATERTPSTHPVAGSPAPDGRTALQNFDGISYAKGSAALRQLIAHIGDDAFVAGITAYLNEFAYGNGTLADFLHAMEQASGIELGSWSRAWLETAGVDTIAVDPAAGRVTRQVPAAHPADRPHTLDVAGFDDGEASWRLPVRIDADAVTVAGIRPAQVVVPNVSDLTWATVDLDPGTLAALPERLGTVPDAQARAVVWTALGDGVCLGTVDPRHLLRVFAAAWPVETEASILTAVAGRVLARTVPCFLPVEERPGALDAVADAARRLVDRGGGTVVEGLRAWSRATSDPDLLRSWSRGEGLPDGFGDDRDLRWLVVRRLAQLGLVDDAAIEDFRAADDTLTGHLASLTARAARPDPEAKAWAWSELTTNRERSNYELNALAEGFWASGSRDLLLPYAARYATDIPPLSGWLGEDALARVATLAYPSRLVSEDVLRTIERVVTDPDLSPAVRRAVVDQGSAMREALRSLATFA